MRTLRTMITLSVLLALVAAPAALAAGKAEKGGKSHDVKASIVSVNAKAKTLTIKDETGKEQTVPVMGVAADKLAGLKAGEEVVLTCQDDAQGNHTGIIGIKHVHKS